MWHRNSGYASLVVVALVSATFGRAEIRVGDVFPALNLSGVTTLARGEMPIANGKVVLVDFWASWCTPCKASFPMMAKLHHEFGTKGLLVAAVSVDENAAAAAAFVKKVAPPFAALHDSKQLLVKQVMVPTMPTSYLVARDGRVRFVHSGFHGQTTEQALRKQIEALLKEEVSTR